VDIIWDKDTVPVELLDLLMKRPDFHSFDYLGSYFFRINVTRSPLNDPRVRKALALAIDKERITRRITRGGEKPASFLVPPGIPNYTPAQGLGYNPDEARALLASAGFPGGRGFPRFTYLFDTSAQNEAIAVELQDMWKRELGIEMDLHSVEWKVWLSSMSRLNFDLCRGGWIGDYTDPNTFLDMFMSTNPNNETGWKSEKYDALMRQANATVDVQERARVLRQAETVLVRDELPIVPLYIYVGFNFFDPQRIEGVYNNLRDEHPLRAIRVKG
jgi:oligopeptide transport system substrate-binding protein